MLVKAGLINYSDTLKYVQQPHCHNKTKTTYAQFGDSIHWRKGFPIFPMKMSILSKFESAGTETF